MSWYQDWRETFRDDKEKNSNDRSRKTARRGRVPSWRNTAVEARMLVERPYVVEFAAKAKLGHKEGERTRHGRQDQPRSSQKTQEVNQAPVSKLNRESSPYGISSSSKRDKFHSCIWKVNIYFVKVYLDPIASRTHRLVVVHREEKVPLYCGRSLHFSTANRGAIRAPWAPKVTGSGRENPHHLPSLI